MLMSKDRVYSSLPNPDFRIPGYMRKVTASSGAGSARAATSDSLWKVHHNFRLHVRSATYVNMKDVDLLYVRVGIYHGNEPLFPERQSRQVGLAALQCDELSNIY